MRGEVQNEAAHKERIRQTAAHFGFDAPTLPDLRKMLPGELRETKVKCRIIYHQSIHEITFERYLPGKIASLKLIEASVDYSFKRADRSALNALLAQKGDCDEVLITRKGLITDTSFSNVVFSRGGRYFTPENPLLNGTRRQKLLREGVITEKKIDICSLSGYDRIYLINALLGMEDGVSLPVNAIIS